MKALTQGSWSLVRFPPVVCGVLLLALVGCSTPDATGDPKAPGAVNGAAQEVTDAGEGSVALPLPPVATEVGDSAATAALPPVIVDEFQTAIDAGMVALRSGDNGEAVARFAAAVALRPDDARAHRMLGNAHARQGNLGQAMTSLQRSIELDDAVAGAHYETAQVAFNLKNLDLAETSARRAIELSPGNPRAADLLATVLHARNDFAGMIEVMEPVVAAAPDRAQTRYMLGLAYFGAGRLEDARRELQKTLRLDPNHILAHRDLAGTLERLGDKEGAARSRRTFEALTGRQN